MTKEKETETINRALVFLWTNSLPAPPALERNGDGEAPRALPHTGGQPPQRELPLQWDTLRKPGPTGDPASSHLSQSLFFGSVI